MPTTMYHRKFLFGGLFLTAMLVFILAAMNTHGQAVSQPAKPAVTDYLWTPGFWSLSRKDYRDEIGLTEEQFKKLQEISQKYAEAVKKSQSYGDWKKLSAEELKKKYAEMTAEYKKRTEESRQQVEAVLTADQLKKLEIIELRSYAVQLLYQDKLRETLGLTDQQKEQLTKARDNMQKKVTELTQKMHRIQDQANKEAINLLTSEQVEQLKKIRREGFSWQHLEKKPGSTQPKK